MVSGSSHVSYLLYPTCLQLLCVAHTNGLLEVLYVYPKYFIIYYDFKTVVILHQCVYKEK